MNAVSKISMPAPEPIGAAQPDGSLVISPEQLARFGNGDPKWGRRELQLILAAEKDQTIRSGPTAKPANVRIAIVSDERAIFDLLMEDLRDNAEQIAPVNPDRVAEHILVCTRKKGGVCGVVDGPDGKPVAVVILHPCKWWWSSAYYWQEVVAYVHPDHRKSKFAVDLMNFARWWTDNFISEHGYKNYLMCGVLGTKRVREKAIFYRRRFAQVGWAFLYPAPPSGGEK